MPIVPLRLVLLCVRFYRGMNAHAEGGGSDISCSSPSPRQGDGDEHTVSSAEVIIGSVGGT